MLSGNPSRRAGIVGLVLFLCTLLLFSRAIGNDFVNYDDPDYVTKNWQVQAGLTWSGAKWAFTTGEASNWHPLTWLSHMADWSLFGDNPHGHHATSVVWHALNAVLLFVVLRRLTGAFWISAFAAALFAWHPLRVESVAWVAERKDVLSAFFGLLTLWAYTIYAERRRANHNAWGCYAGALAAFATGLLCKPMLVTLPCVLLLLDYWPLGRWRRTTAAAGAGEAQASIGLGSLVVEKLPFLALATASSVVTYLVQQKGGSVSFTLSLGERVANVPVAIVAYLGKFVWPVGLAVLYPHPGTWPAGEVLAAALAVLAFSGLALWQWRRRPWLIVGWLSFLGMLVPVSGLVQVGLQFMADRYTYLPMIGVTVALVWTLGEVAVAFSIQRALGVVAAVVLTGCAVRTWDQLGIWRNSVTLFDYAVRVTEKNYLAYNNLGNALLDLGRVPEAVAQFELGLHARSDFAETHWGLANALVQLGRSPEAIPQYEEALRLNPLSAEAHCGLADALAQTDRVAEAEQHYREALRLEPDFPEAHNNEGNLLFRTGRIPEAIADYRAALRLKPRDIEGRVNLANALLETGQPAEALKEYQLALTAKPDDADAHYGLANACAQLNRLSEAADAYRETLRLKPDYLAAHVNLGNVLLLLGRLPAAIAEYEAALRLNPDDVTVRANLDQARQLSRTGPAGKP